MWLLSPYSIPSYAWAFLLPCYRGYAGSSFNFRTTNASWLRHVTPHAGLVSSNLDFPIILGGRLVVADVFLSLSHLFIRYFISFLVPISFFISVRSRCVRMSNVTNCSSGSLLVRAYAHYWRTVCFSPHFHHPFPTLFLVKIHQISHSTYCVTFLFCST